MEQMASDVQQKVVAIPTKRAERSIEDNIRFIVRTILKEELKPLLVNLIHDDGQVQDELTRCLDDDVENKVTQYFDDNFESSFQEHSGNMNLKVDVHALQDAFWIEGK